jgi:hypothetical protein
VDFSKRNSLLLVFYRQLYLLLNPTRSLHLLIELTVGTSERELKLKENLAIFRAHHNNIM